MTLGAAAYPEALRAGFGLAFAPAAVVARLGLGVAVGAAAWALTSSATTALVTGLAVPLAISLVLCLRLALGLRAGTEAGTTVTSGYDGQGDLLLVRPGLVRRLTAGSARQVQPRGDLWLVHPLRARGARTLLVRRELLTADDITFLTTPPPEVAPEGAVIVTAEMHRLMRQALLRQFRRPPILVILALLVAIPTACVLVDRRLWPLALISLGGAATVLLLSRIGFGIIWRVGAPVAARVEGDALVMHIPYFPERVALARIRGVRVHGEVLELGWQPLRRWTLPTALLSEADLDVLRRC